MEHRRYRKRLLMWAVPFAVLPALAAAAGSSSGENLAASDSGGVIESITDEAGPGFIGRRLIDGRSEPVWKAAQPRLPQEIVVSFFNRKPALVSAVALGVPDRAPGAPKQVEVWTSTAGPKDGFSKAAAQTLDGKRSDVVIAFSAREAGWVKLRVLSTQKGSPLELAELRVIEGKRSGYVALSSRHPEMATWSTNPRHVAQLGIDWLEPAAIQWQQQARCYGCHNQAQVVMGLALAERNQYVVSDDTLRALVDFTAKVQHPNGSIHDGLFITATQFAAMSFAHYDEARGVKTPALLKACDFILGAQKPSGELPADQNEPPIAQGSLMTSANALVALDQAARETGDAKYRDAATRALQWIASAQPETTQDEVFQLLALTRYSSPERRQIANALLDRLTREQNADGGWQETRKSKGSNAYATGQVLYALKVAGVGAESPSFSRAVAYLVETQNESGSWHSVNSASRRPSEFAPTMWAVIGLAGSYRASNTGTLQVVSQLDQSAQLSATVAKNILVILDASGSMKAKLGKSTRIDTARKVIEELIDKIPADYNVGLRFYAHRAKPKSGETCTDTEVVLPVGPLDRARFIAAIDGVQPRGDTPLVYSTIQAANDLRAAGGGTIILITDGEESCGGDPKQAADALTKAGIELKLNIVGFTLKGKQVEDDLTNLAESVGGHYYPAADGEALFTSLARATSRYPYAVIDRAGRTVAKGETDGDPVEVKPGDYRLVLYTGTRELYAEQINVKTGAESVVCLGGDADRLSVGCRPALQQASNLGPVSRAGEAPQQPFAPNMPAPSSLGTSAPTPAPRPSSPAAPIWNGRPVDGRVRR